MKYGKVTLGQIEALLNKIGGPDQMKRIISGRSRVVIVDAEPWCKVLIGGKWLSLVVQSARSLGVSIEEATISNVYEAAAAFDLGFCPLGTHAEIDRDFLKSTFPKGLGGGGLNFATPLTEAFGPQYYWHGASKWQNWKSSIFKNDANASAILDSFVFVLR
jgi:hypothetical protein